MLFMQSNMGREEVVTYSKKVMTLVYLVDGEYILLGFEKRGLGAGQVKRLNNLATILINIRM